MFLRNLWKVKSFCVFWKLSNWMLSITVNFYIENCFTKVFHSSITNSLKKKFIFIIFIMIIFIVSFLEEHPQSSGNWLSYKILILLKKVKIWQCFQDWCLSCRYFKKWVLLGHFSCAISYSRDVKKQSPGGVV